MNETKELAKFAVELKYEDLPQEVRKKTEELLLDQFASQVASSIKPWSQAVYKYIRDMGSRGESTIVTYGDKVAAENAAYVNGMFGRGFEIDDTHRPSLSHPGSVMVPAALALGERDMIDGKTLSLAMVVGYEVMCRIGRSLAPSALERGWDPTPIVAPIGAAAVAGKILSFNYEQMVNAFGIAASYCSGLMEFAQSGGHTVRLHAGLSAQSGIRSAFLAKNGLIGPSTALEGKNGLCKALADDYRLEDITSGFGKSWVVMEVVYKRYHTDYFLQTSIDAALKIIKEHKIDPKDVDHVIVGINRHGPRVVGKIVEPKDITSSHFSGPFCLALTFVKGSNSFKDYTEENLSDPAVLNMARKVSVEVDPEMDALYPAKRAGKVTVNMKNGKTYQEKVIDAKGTPDNPMTMEEMEEKFRSLASVALPAEKIQEVINIIRGLEELKDVSRLSRLLIR